MEKKPEPLIAVDLTRFACAALVVCYHYLTTRWLDPSPEAAALLAGVSFPPSDVIASGRFAWIGVQLFFVISGLVIARTSEDTGALLFLKRRLLRLAPAVIVCSMATMLVLALAGEGDAALLIRLIRSLIFWPFGRQIDPSYWTLGVELAFYALVAFMIRRRGAASMEKTACLLVAWSGAFWIVMAFGERTGHPAAINIYGDLLLLAYGCFFALGMLLTIVARDGLNRQRASAMVAATAFCCMQIAWKAGEQSLVLPLECEPAVPIIVFLVGVAILACSWKVQPILARVANPATARAAGLATYPLYLVHQEAGTVLIAVLAKFHVPTLHAMILTTIAALVAAWIVAMKMEPGTRRCLIAALDIMRTSVADVRLHRRPTMHI